jgi:tripartite-type tricarboxylate transporter receptor subunit TctC
MQRRQMLMAALGSAAVLPRGASAQKPWPEHPLKLVVPFPPGGPTDTFARRYADQLAKVLGQPVVVDNRAGAGGTIGAASVARSAPDGYTVLFGTSSTQVTSPLLMASAPYDPLNDFQLLIVGTVPLVVAVHPGLAARSLQALLQLVRAEPGRHRFSSAGVGSVNHLGAELLLSQAGGLKALHVPYKGTAPAQLAVMSGEVDFLLDTFGTALPQHKAGKVRILATCGEQRSPAAPDIPTVAEAGVPQASVATVNVVALPAGVPQGALSALAAATRKVMADPGLVAALAQLGIEPVADADTERSRRFFAAELERWRPIVKASGATL